METEKINLLDLNDNVLHDTAWASKQPAGTKVLYVGPKGDSGNDELSLAIGEGRDGSNALRVRCNDKTQGLPGFWLFTSRATGKQVANYSTDLGYMAPRGKKPTKLHLWLKFPEGFFKERSAMSIKGYPYHQTLHLGTYQFAPGLIGNKGAVVKESNNWHGYHQCIIRHDLAKGDWVHLVLNDCPMHQRALNQDYGPNYCGSHGQYWDLTTRFYFDVVPNFIDPEIDYPFEMLVDSIYFTCDEPEKLVEIEVLGYKNGQSVEVKSQVETEFKVLVKNLKDESINGRFSLRSTWGVRGKIKGEKNATNIPDLQLGPKEEKSLTISFCPKDAGSNSFVGFAFVPSNQIMIEEMQYLPSNSDPNVGISKSVFWGYGANDADTYGTTLRLLSVESISSDPTPVSQGGSYYQTGTNQPLNGKIDGFCSSRKPLTYKLISTQSSGGSFVLNEDGSFVFTPEKDFEGSFFFRYQLSNGAKDSIVYGSWVIVKKIENPLKNLTDKEIILISLEKLKPNAEELGREMHAKLDIERIDEVITNLK